jgi:glycosyltransferase involved in cell wall biosynthesis
MPEFILYAPNVHSGGGAVLLKEMLLNAPSRCKIIAILDKRIQTNLTTHHLENINVKYWVQPTIFSRIYSELILYKLSDRCKVFCFHNIPPILNRSRSITVFFQNRLIIQANPEKYTNLKVFFITYFERVLNILLHKRVATYITQTQSMAFSLKNSFLRNAKANIQILPLSPAINKIKGLDVQKIKIWDFCYISSGDTHKNHLNLIAAWKILASEGIFPSLSLTINSRYTALCELIKKECLQSKISIENLGDVNHSTALNIYSKSGALIFPSFSESFGLPLVEASLSGIPIIASELDFVRDVCEPIETFDPNSPNSIARAVKRFLGIPENSIRLMSANDFWECLL